MYFDEITLDSSDEKNKVICKTGGIDFLTFHENLTRSSSEGILVKNNVGESTRIESQTAIVYGYGYKIGGVLMISFRLNCSFTAPRIAITKDNFGNTTIVTEKSLMTDSGTAYYIKVCNTNSQPLDGTNNSFKILREANNASALTSMCPFVVCGQEASYTPDVFYTPFTQYTGETVYDINGTKYLSNDFFAVKIQEGE